MTNKRKAIWFLTSGVVLMLIVLLWRWQFHEGRHYLRGNVIRLIDDMNEECIRRSPLTVPLRAIRKECLNQGWEKVATLESGIDIWHTHSSHFIVGPFNQSPEGSTKVYREGLAFKLQSDLFGPDTVADCWSSQDNQIFISAPKGEDPNRKKYFADYMTFRNAGLEMVDKEILDNPIIYAVVHDGPVTRKVVAYPVRHPAWMQLSKTVPSHIVVCQKGKVLPFRQGLPEQLSSPSEKTISIYPSSPSASAKPFQLFKSSDKLEQRLHISPGPYFIKIVAKASLAGPDPPLAIIKLNGQRKTRFPIPNEDWQTHIVHTLIEEADTEFCLEYPNDYFNPKTLKDRNIIIAEIVAWPDESSSGTPFKTALGHSRYTSWSWLDNFEDVLYEATPLGMFSMLTEKDVCTIRRFFRRGVASIRVTAKADLAGQEMSALAVYLDKKKIGTIRITDTAYREYSLENVPIALGQHEINMVFENDFYNPQTQEDRNIYLIKVAIEYPSTVLIDEPGNRPAGRLIISYPSKAPSLNQFRLYQEFSVKETGRMNPVARPIDQAGDMRAALVCPPPTRLVFRIQVPLGGKLRFGYGTSFSNYRQSEKEMRSCSARLVIRIKEAFLISRTIFSRDFSNLTSDLKAPWTEEVIELDEFGGKKVELSFETQAIGSKLLVPPCLFIGYPVLSSASRQARKEPNIVLITADALRADHLSCYGYGRKTSPNIDQFARESVLFENAVSPASWTLPALASLFTSLYPSFHGTNVWDARLLSSKSTLPNILNKNGYLTAACVDNIFLYPSYGLSEGFDFYKYRNAGVEEQVQTVTKWLDSMKDQKFFLWVHFLSPHAPYLAPLPFSSAFGKPVHPNLDASISMLTLIEQSGRRLSPSDRAYFISQYDGKMLYLDDIIKRLFDHLKQLDLYQDTLVIFLSDHGEQFQEHGHLQHGNSLYEEEIHVPLIIKLPSDWRQSGIRIPGVMSSIDVFPTILDLINVLPPDSIQGKSLIPLLRQMPFRDNTVISELHVAGKIAIRKGRYKYIYADPKIIAETRKDPRFLKSQVKPFEELYDLETNPAETRNLSGARPDLLDFYRSHRDKFMDFALRFRQRKFGEKESNRFVLDAKSREQLRALGYLR
jgi:arylsulfatase A-like enzyme